jgi:hypothetical protein
VAEIYFNFFFKQCEIQIGAKTHRVTCHKSRRGYFAGRTNSFPEWRENPIYRKSRNE